MRSDIYITLSEYLSSAYWAWDLLGESFFCPQGFLWDNYKVEYLKMERA